MKLHDACKDRCFKKDTLMFVYPQPNTNIEFWTTNFQFTFPLHPPLLEVTCRGPSNGDIDWWGWKNSIILFVFIFVPLFVWLFSFLVWIFIWICHCNVWMLPLDAIFSSTIFNNIDNIISYISKELTHQPFGVSSQPLQDGGLDPLFFCL